MANIRKGDKVQVISGKDKGKTGTVLRVIPADDRVIVEGVNRAIKHNRPTPGVQGSTGGIEHIEAPIHVSNVMLVGSDGKPTRVGRRTEEVAKQRTDGSTYAATRNVRVEKRTGKDVSS